MSGEFEWDESKRRANLSERGIDFADALRLDWTTTRIAPDHRFDYGEVRFIAHGLIDGRLHVLVYTLREGRRRVISLRKANLREQRKYAVDTGRPVGDP